LQEEVHELKPAEQYLLSEPEALMEETVVPIVGEVVLEPIHGRARHPNSIAGATALIRVCASPPLGGCPAV